MAITLTGANGLFTILGHMGGILGVGTTLTNKDVNDYRGTVLKNKFNQILIDAAVATQRSVTVDGIESVWTAMKSAMSGGLNQVQNYMQAMLIRMANDDTPLSSQTVAAAMQLLVTQMTGAATVNASTVAAGTVTAVGSPTGDNVIVVSIKNGKGVNQEYLFPETITFTCSQDVQGGATAWREPFTVTSPAQVGDSLSELWPGGSGLANSLTAIDSLLDNGGGAFNLLQNSDFETFTTTNAPDNWVRAVGSGTFFSEVTNIFGPGTKSLKILGDGATLSTLRQPFLTTPTTVVDVGGTLYALKPDTVYHGSYWYKNSNASPATGVLRVALVDGSNAVINDDAGTANSSTVTLSGVADTNWHNVNFAFRTPANVNVQTAGNYKLEIKLTTALENAKSVYIDRMTLAAATQLYSGGPFVTIHSGQTKPLKSDAWTSAITNTWGLFQRLFQKTFDMRSLGLQLPSSGAPSINDNLIA